MLTILRESAVTEDIIVRTYLIEASWDVDGEVWCATSPDIAGLNAEADTFDELFSVVKILIPELIDLKANEEIEFELVATRSERLKITAQA